jgi:hypothetical protein
MNEKVNMHIKFSGFLGFDMNKDDCFLEILTSQKGEGNCSTITIHSPRKRILDGVDCSEPSAMGISPNPSLRNLVLADAFVHFL